MLVTRKSPLSGNTHTMELAITEDQIARYQLCGEMIQEVFPHLTAEEREFLLTGITPAELDDAFTEVEN